MTINRKKLNSLLRSLAIIVIVTTALFLLLNNREVTNLTDERNQDEEFYIDNNIDKIMTEKLGFTAADMTAINSCVISKESRPFKNNKLEALRNGIGVTPGIVIGKFLNGDVVKGTTIVELKEITVYEDLIKKVSTKEAISSDFRAEVVTSGFPVIGTIAPGKLAIVEYCDLNCTTCGKLHDRVIPELIAKYVLTGQAVYVYKPLPLDVNGEVATTMAKTAMCIKERFNSDMFFNFSDAVFNLQKQTLHY